MGDQKPDTHHDEERAPELAEMHLPDKADGPAAAAMVAAGVGIFALGLLTVLSEVSEPIHTFLEKMEFGRGVGPLAGKTILAVVIWGLSWAVLAGLWRAKDVSLRSAFAIGLVLGILGAVGTFPPFFLSFGG